MRKSRKQSVMAVNSPQVEKEKTFYIHLLVECFCIVFQKYILRQDSRISLGLNLKRMYVSRFVDCHMQKRLYFRMPY